MVTLGSPAPLPEGLALSTIKSNRGDDNDGVGLVPGRSHAGEILVTNQIVQVSQPTSRGEDRSQQTVEEGTAQSLEWGIQPLPQSHLAGQRSKV